jgi:transcriptional regulator with XRE-family HTH domain
MKHRDYVAAREARDPAFKAAREALRPEYERQRALIQARIAAGLTQQELAERLGTSQSVVARLESGKHPPRLDTLIAVATALGAQFSIAPGHGLTFVPERARTVRRVRAVRARTGASATVKTGRIRARAGARAKNERVT